MAALDGALWEDLLTSAEWRSGHRSSGFVVSRGRCGAESEKVFSSMQRDMKYFSVL